MRNLRNPLQDEEGMISLQGVLYVVGASLLFGMLPTANKVVMTSGMSAECVTFFSQFIIFVLSLIYATIKHISIRVSTKQFFHLILVGAIGMGATAYLVASSCLLIPVGLATMLHFLYPTIVSLVMVLLYAEKISKHKAVAILCSILGMLMITNPGVPGSVDWRGILLALASSVTYSFYIISNEKGNFNELPQIVKMIIMSLGSAALFFVIMSINNSFTLPKTVLGGLLLFIISIGTLGAFFLIMAGIHRIGASVASFVNMLEPITSVIVSSVFYHDYLKLTILIGMALILLSVFLVAVDGIRKRRKTKLCNKHN